MSMTTYFRPIDTSELGKTMNQKFNLHSGDAVIEFKSDNASKMKSATMEFIVNGLNHMLAWAQDNPDPEKETFLQELILYMALMKKELTGKGFEEEVIRKIKGKESKDPNEARAEILVRVIQNIPEGIYDGIIRYVDENSYNNTENNMRHETSLDDVDILTLNCIITMSKIITIAFTILPKMRIEFYTYRPIMNSIQIFSKRMANYYLNHSHDINKYYQVLEKDLSETVYNFIYLTINGNEKPEGDAPLEDLFKKNAMTKGVINESIYKNLITSIYKNVPIEYENTASSVVYSTGEPYQKYKFVHKNTIKYIKDMVIKMLNRKYMLKLPHIVNSHEMKNNDDDYSSSLKQELYLHKNNVSDISRRRKFIEIIKRYCDDYFARHNLIIRRQITKTSLGDYFIIKILQEIGEDYVSAKFFDIRTYNKLIHVISNVLFENGYTTLSLAIISDDVVPSSLYLQPRNQDRIRNLSIVRRYPSMATKNLEKIIGVAYKSNDGQKIIDISDEFISFLEKDDDGTNNIKFIDNYIFNYE